jgi:hypothetical protein
VRFISFICTLFFVAPALAFPAVGDRVVFDGTYTSPDGLAVVYTQTMEIVAFDAGAEIFTLSNTFVSSGKPIQDTETIPASEMVSDIKVREVLDGCEAAGGTIEDIRVPAGTFRTCRSSKQDGGTVWTADVPFGLVKEIYFDGEDRVEVELRGLHAGQ